MTLGPTRSDRSPGRATYAARLCLRDSSGSTAIEYGLVAGLLSIVIFTATASVGARVATVFEQVASKFP